MFTLNIRNIVAVGRGGVKWDASNALSAAPFESQRHVFLELLKVTPINRNLFLRSLSMDELTIIEKEISALKRGTQGNMTWRGEVSAEIIRLKNVEKAKKPTPTLPAALVPASVLEANPQAAANQALERNKVVQEYAKEVVAVQQSTVENLNGLNTEVLIQRIFNLPPNIFAGEITKTDKFQELLITSNAIVSRNMPTPTTPEEWVKLGYSGEGAFTMFGVDKKEMAVLTAFINTIKEDPKNKSILKHILERGTNDDALIDTLKTIQSTQVVKDTKDIKAQSVDKGTGKLIEAESDEASIVDQFSRLSSKNSKLATTASIYGVSEAGLKLSIQTSMHAGRKFSDIYKTITNTELPENLSGRELIAAKALFQEKLMTNLAIVQAISGGSNAGLDAVLQGGTEQLITRIQESSTPMTIRLKDSSMTDAVVNTMSVGTTVVVSVLSGGIITVSPKIQNTIDGKTMFDELTKKDPTFGDKLGAGATWLGKLMVGRVFSLDIGNADSHEALKNRILAIAPELQKLTLSTKSSNIEDPTIKEAFEYAQTHGLLKTDADLRGFQIGMLDGAINSNMRAEGDKTNWWFSLNPFFAGVHRDAMKHTVIQTEFSDANTQELQATRGRFSKPDIAALLTALGETITSDKKFGYTIPTHISTPTLTDVPVRIDGKSITENVVLTDINAQEFTFNRVQLADGTVYIDIKHEDTKASTKIVDTTETAIDTELNKLTGQLQGTLLQLSSVEIRHKYARLQAAIRDIKDAKSLDIAWTAYSKAFPKDAIKYQDYTPQKKETHLLSILGEFAGDWRFRALRLAQKDPTLMNDKKFMGKVRLALPTSGIPIRGLNDTQIKDKVSKLTMKDLEPVNIAPENDKYENDMLPTYGTSGNITVKEIKEQYRKNDRDHKLYEAENGQAVGGYGFMINHQVLGTGKNKKTTFSGASPVTPEMRMRLGEPIELKDEQVNKHAFINQLTSLQMNRLVTAVQASNPSLKDQINPDALKSHLTNTVLIAGLSLDMKLYYAQFPNCTNSMIFMRMTGKHGEIIAPESTVFGGETTVLGKEVNSTGKFDGGVNPIAAIDKLKKDTNQQPDQNKPESITTEPGGAKEVPRVVTNPQPVVAPAPATPGLPTTPTIPGVKAPDVGVTLVDIF